MLRGTNSDGAGMRLAAVLAATCVVALLVLPCGALARRPSARASTRVSISAAVTAGEPITVTVHVAAGLGRVIVKVQELQSGRFRTLVQRRGHGRRRVVLSFRAPAEAGTVIVRVRVLRGRRRVLWLTRSQTVIVRLGEPAGVQTVDLSAPGGEEPAAALLPNGSTILLYVVRGSSGSDAPAPGTVWASELDAGATQFSSPSEIAGGLDPGEPAVSVGPDGTIVAAWSIFGQSEEPSSWVSVRAPGQSTFGAAVEIQPADQTYTPDTPLPLVDGSGQLDVLWYNENPGDGEAYVQVRDAGSTAWSAPQKIGVDEYSPVLLPDGEQLVITDCAEYCAVPHPFGGSWGAPATIWRFVPSQAGVTGFSPGYPVGAASSSGTVAAVWGFNTGGVDQLMVSVRSPLGAWSAPTTLDSNSDPNFTYSYRATGDGQGHFTVLAPAASGSGENLVAYTSDPTGASWTPSTVVSDFSSNDWFNVVSSSNGNTAVVYDRVAPNDQSAQLFLTLRRAGSTSWSAPIELASDAYPTDIDPGIVSGGLTYFDDDDPAVIAVPTRVQVIWDDNATGGLRAAAVPW